MKLVIQNGSRVWGGNEKWLATLADGLKRRGHDVVISCAPGPVTQTMQQRGFRTTSVRPRGPADLAGGARFARWLRSERPDAVLMTSWRPVTWVALGSQWAGVQRTVLRQGIVRECPSTGPRAYALRRIVNAIIVNSEEIRDVWLRSSPSFPRDRLHVVLNGIAPSKTNRVELRTKLRREIGANDDEILIGGAGHLFARKGFDFLIRAFAIARVARSRLIIAGDGEHRPQLEALSSELGIPELVHFLGHRNDAPDVIGGLDVFVLASHNEGMANVMLEAMAAGAPVIASDISGVRKAIGETDTRPAAGWIVPPADEKSLAAALSNVSSQIRSDPDAIAARTDEARWRIEHWFSPERMVDECEAILFAE